MRLQFRNLKKFYVGELTGSTEIKDSAGNRTGEYKDIYSGFKEMYGSFSVPASDISREPFGIFRGCEYVISLQNVDKTISETSVVWKDCGLSEKPDYKVRSIAYSLNQTFIGIERR